MNTLTIILIVLTATLLIANIVMFVTERATTKNKYELNFDESKVKIILLASEDAHKLVEKEIKLTKEYYVLNSSIGYLKTKHGTIYISAYLVERK